MSLAEVRQDIADALSTVDGITGYVAPPSVMGVGDAWALLANLTAAGPAGLFEADWRVQLITGRTPADGIPYLDDVLGDVTDALAPVAWVASVTPVTLATPSGDLYAVELQLTRE